MLHIMTFLYFRLVFLGGPEVSLKNKNAYSKNAGKLFARLQTQVFFEFTLL